MLRGDFVKDDSGMYAVFTEQVSSVSQMTAAHVMDVIAKQPDCVGPAADAVYTHTQVKMKDAPQLWTLSEVRISKYFDTSSTTIGPNHVPKLKILWFLLSEICLVSRLLASCGKDNFEEVLPRIYERK